jgi:hypothetical protein
MALIGVAFVVGTGQVRLAATGVEVSARVINPGELVVDSNDPDYYRNIEVSFEYPDGTPRQEVIARSSVSSIGQISSGSVLTITVDPQDPSTLSANSKEHIREGMLFSAVLLTLIVLAAAAVFLWPRLHNRATGTA